MNLGEKKCHIIYIGTSVRFIFENSREISKNMSSGVGKAQILSLYKTLMRESQKFANYNYRLYALRRVRDAFKDNKSLTDNKIIKKEFEFGKENLNIIRRQAAIGDMYKTEKLVIENQ